MPTKSNIGATAVQMTTSSRTPFHDITIRADANNSGVVYVGFGSGVTAGTVDATDGFPLNAGDVLSLPVSQVKDPCNVWLIGSASGQKVQWDCDLSQMPLSRGSSAGGFGAQLIAIGRVIDEAGNVLAVKQKSAVVTSSGVNAFIAAVTSKKIRVLAYRLQSDTDAITATFYDTAGSPAQITSSPSHVLHAIDPTLVVTAPQGGYEFQSASGAGVQVNLSGAANVAVTIIYCEVP